MGLSGILYEIILLHITRLYWERGGARTLGTAAAHCTPCSGLVAQRATNGAALLPLLAERLHAPKLRGLFYGGRGDDWAATKPGCRVGAGRRAQ